VAILIDTSALIDAERSGLPIDRRFDAETTTISVVTANELLHGVRRASKERVRARRAAFVEGVLAALDHCRSRSPSPVHTPASGRTWSGAAR
jgi:predicted nucleic acid-binding protein